MLKWIAIASLVIFFWVIYIKWRTKIGSRTADEFMHLLAFNAEASHNAFLKILKHKGIVESSKPLALAGYLGSSPMAIGYLALESNWQIKPDVRLAFRQSGKQITGVDLLQAASGFAVKAAGSLSGADLDAVKSVVNSTGNDLIEHSRDIPELRRIYSNLWLKAFQFANAPGDFVTDADVLAEVSITIYKEAQKLVRR